MPTLVALLIFDAFAAVAAFAPGMMIPEPGSTVAHIVVSAVNVVLLARIFGALCPAIYITFVLGIGCEAFQLLGTGRSASFGDVLADCAGIVLAVGALMFFPASTAQSDHDRSANASDDMGRLCGEDASA